MYQRRKDSQRTDPSVDTSNHSRRETKETQNGRLTQKGNKFHVDNNGNQIYCDGVTVWMYMKNNNTSVAIKVVHPEIEYQLLCPVALVNLYTYLVTNFKCFKKFDIIIDLTAFFSNLEKQISMETKILEEFIEELKQIVPDNNASYNPNLMRSQVFVIDEIIKMAEQKALTYKSK
jgi:hypothetical protein